MNKEILSLALLAMLGRSPEQDSAPAPALVVGDVWTPKLPIIDGEATITKVTSNEVHFTFSSNSGDDFITYNVLSHKGFRLLHEFKRKGNPTAKKPCGQDCSFGFDIAVRALLDGKDVLNLRNNKVYNFRGGNLRVENDNGSVSIAGGLPIQFIHDKWSLT